MKNLQILTKEKDSFETHSREWHALVMPATKKSTLINESS